MAVGGLRPGVGPPGAGAWRPPDHPGPAPVRPAFNDMQDVQQRLLRDQAAATAAFIDNFRILGDEVAALKSSHAAFGDIATKAEVKELKDRIAQLESVLRGHEGAHDSAHSKLQALHERLGAVEGGDLQRSLDDFRDTHDLHHNEMLARMAQVEGRMSDCLDKNDKHGKALDFHQSSNSELSSELKAQSAHQAHLLQRLGHTESMVGEAARRHAAELAAAQKKLDQLQQHVLGDGSGAALEELRQGHAKLAADKDAAAVQHEKLRDQHSKLEQRLKDMERKAADGHGDHVMQLMAASNSVKDVHAKLGAERSDQEARFRAADERLKNLEAYVGSSANDHALSVNAVHQSLKDLHGEVADELNKRGVHHASMEDRLRRLEVASGDSLDSHSASLEAAHQRIDDFDSQLRDARQNIMQVHESLRGDSQSAKTDQLAAEERLKRLEKVHESHGKKLQELHGRLASPGKQSAPRDLQPQIEDRIRSLETRVLGMTSSNVLTDGYAKQAEPPQAPSLGISAAAMADWSSMSTMDRSFFKSVTAVIVQEDGGAPLALPQISGSPSPQASPISPMGRVASLPSLQPGRRKS